MSDEQTQTTPMGVEIPVPERDVVLAAFRKAAHAPALGPDDGSDTDDQAAGG